MTERLNGARVRAIAQGLNNKIDKQHPCHLCHIGTCCEADILITPDDEAEITQAVKRKQIIPSVIKAAQERVKKGTDKCGFLNEANKCTIYQFRPALCIATGGAGVPTDTIKNHEAIDLFESSGIDIGIPVSNTSTSMCVEGYIRMASSEKSFRVADVINFEGLLKYSIYKGKRTIKDFIGSLKVK